MERDVKLAMLGDRAAQERLTERGVLLPCPFCGGEAKINRISNGYRTSPATIINKWIVKCVKGCTESLPFESEIFQDGNGEIHINKNGAAEAKKAWNTRAPILSAEELERLEDNHDE